MTRCIIKNLSKDFYSDANLHSQSEVSFSLCETGSFYNLNANATGLSDEEIIYLSLEKINHLLEKKLEKKLSK